MSREYGALRRTLVAAATVAALTIPVWPGDLAAAEPAVPVTGVSPGGLIADGAVAPGSLLWARRYVGPAAQGDFAGAAAVSPDGSMVFVTGNSAGAGTGSDYATVAYDAVTGAERWVSRYSGPGNRTDFATAIAVSPDGSMVFVTGSSAGADHAVGVTGYDYATVAYDAVTGARRWASRYDDPVSDDDLAWSVAAGPGGNTVYVTGGSHGMDNGETDYATIAYNAATGARRWVSRFRGGQAATSIGRVVAVGPGGGSVYVTGSSGDGRIGFSDYATVAYNAGTGARRWVSRYNGRADRVDIAHSLAVGPDGRTIFVTGTSTGRTSGHDYATVAYNAGTGARRWVSRYNGRANLSDEAHSVAVGPGGHAVYVTGSSKGIGFDYATVAYNAATGMARWVRRYNEGQDAARVVAVGPGGGTVYVTGTGQGNTADSHYATLAYNARNGARKWISLSSAGAVAAAMALSKDGSKVFVTGSSRGYWTIAIKA